MEREGNRNRLNIVARSVAAVSIAAAGSAAVEKTGVFDRLSYPVNSANHLVLNNLHKSSEQLIDKLPVVEKAEAEPQANCISRTEQLWSWCDVLPSMNWTVVYDEYAGGHTQNTFTVNSVENEGCLISGPDIDDNHTVTVLVTSFGGTETNPTNACPPTLPCPGGSPSGDGAVIALACPPSVGGVAELPDLNNLPQNLNSEKSKHYTISIAAGLAATAAALTATGAALYTRRNRSVR